ncbi:IS3 family transposase [Bacillus proteolyticus]|uniref:IS3 family transposase n=1 Tax=Bacillus proteolyticus TaxID=2026192 RepID=UPI0009FF878C
MKRVKAVTQSSHINSLEDLSKKLQDYVHWFNHIQIHGTLGYVSPIQYNLEHLKKTV